MRLSDPLMGISGAMFGGGALLILLGVVTSGPGGLFDFANAPGPALAVSVGMTLFGALLAVPVFGVLGIVSENHRATVTATALGAAPSAGGVVVTMSGRF